VIGTAEAAPYEWSAPPKRRPTSDRHRRSGALRPQPSVRRAPLLGVPVAWTLIRPNASRVWPMSSTWLTPKTPKGSWC